MFYFLFCFLLYRAEVNEKPICKESQSKKSKMRARTGGVEVSPKCVCKVLCPVLPLSVVSDIICFQERIPLCII